MSNKFKIVITSILVVVFGVVGVVFADDIINNFYGEATVNMPSGGSEAALGAVTPTGGICDGSEPATTLCNVSIYELDVDTDAAIDEDLSVGGELQAQRVVQGGSVISASSSLSIAMSLTAAQVCDNSVIKVNDAAVANDKTAASLDITLPATSTLFADCLDTSGDSVSFWFMNNSPTSATSTEIIAGTGCDARISGDTGATDTILGGYGAKITLIRATDVLGDGGSMDCLAVIEPNKVD
jgi:hypothetical protein